MSSLGDVVTLQVGERRFTTTISTLTASSAYFASKFSGRWTITASDDGSFFIDANPSIFEFLLDYMRNGMKPLYWSKTHGFHHAKYFDLLQQAQFFGVQGLAEWISSKGYEQMIQVTESVRINDVTNGTTSFPVNGGVDTEHRIIEIAQKYTKCGKYNDCPRVCPTHGSDARDFVIGPSHKMMTILRRTTANYDL